MPKQKMAKPQNRKISRAKAVNEKFGEDKDNEDVDLDVYGASMVDDDEGQDHDEVSLGDDEAIDLDDLDTDPLSDDEDAIDGMSIDADEDEEGGDPIASLAAQLADLANQLAAEVGADVDDEEGDDFGDDATDLEFDDAEEGGEEESYDDLEVGGDEEDLGGEEDDLTDDEDDESEAGPKLREENSPTKWVPKNKGTHDQKHTASEFNAPGKASLPPGKGATGKENRPDQDRDLKHSKTVSQGKKKAKVPKAKGAANVGNDGGKPEKTVSIDKVMTKASESLEIHLAKEASDFAALGGFLTESARAKGRALFLNAVRKRMGTMVEAIDAHYRSVFREEVATMQAGLVEKIDEYLDFVVAEFLEENAVAVDQGLGLEISESFLAGMRQLFETHNVEVPKTKVDMVQKLQRQLAVQEAREKELYERSLKLRKENIRLHRNDVIKEAAEELSALEGEKLQKLAETIEYRSKQQFAADIGILKQTHFGRRARVSETPPSFESIVEHTQTPPADEMALYANAISRHASRNK